ncbi:hypothetical protein PcPA57_05220 [Pasteurella canis]|uniref:hypothetical protein n=1 Tax=Pasteurella canis TaxID=753 RepID=UPI001E333D23|nr:hypothetical protein [Pasteurella canis]GJJ79802.1 hypothetical protein PcPA57_05220 [Pasteurella canis]
MSLANQLAKLTERAYQEKAYLDYQITEIHQRKNQLNEQIQTFERALGYIDPDFDLRTIQKQFKAHRTKVRPFNQNVGYLLSLVLNQAEDWLKLNEITCRVVKLEGKYEQVTQARLLAVGNALRRLYKQGIV